MAVINNWAEKSKADKIFKGVEIVKDAGIYAITSSVINTFVCATGPIGGVALFISKAAIATWIQKETSDAMIDEVNELSEELGCSPELITEEKWRK